MFYTEGQSLEGVTPVSVYINTILIISVIL